MLTLPFSEIVLIITNIILMLAVGVWCYEVFVPIYEEIDDLFLNFLLIIFMCWCIYWGGVFIFTGNL